MKNSNPYEASDAALASDVVVSEAYGRLWFFPWLFGACSLIVTVLFTDLIYPLPGPTYAYWVGGLAVAFVASLNVSNRSRTRIVFVLGAIVLSALQLIPIGYYLAWPYLH